ncbi:MAG: hypothetical protein C4521_01945 [Actinobacteria bacterium]|nr:MAG: hypothetical protein C4521_01945 [Actinomycetota bacterium]
MKPRIPWRNRARSFWWKRIRPAWHATRWPTIGGLTLLALLLGFVGFREHFTLLGEDRSPWDCFYLSLQLFTLESGSIVPPIPMELQVARLLAPALAVFAAVQAAVSVLQEQWQRLRTRFVRNHVIVCGLGQRGLRFAEQFAERGHSVVVVERDEENPLIERCRQAGIRVLIGDVMDPAALTRARLGASRYLVSVCAEDGTNAEVAAQALASTGDASRRGLAAFIHIVDLELCSLLRKKERTSAKDGSVRLEFFNVMESGARIMLHEVPVLRRARHAGDGLLHLVVVGLGSLGRSLVIQAANEWWLDHREDGSRLRVTVIDRAANEKVELLRIRCPRLEEACELVVLALEKESPEFERGEFLFDGRGLCSAEAVYLCFEDDVHVVADALVLRHRMGSDEVPIIMRMTRQAGLVALLQADGRETRKGSANLHAIGLLDRTCTYEALMNQTRQAPADEADEWVCHDAEACLSKADQESEESVEGVFPRGG